MTRLMLSFLLGYSVINVLAQREVPKTQANLQPGSRKYQSTIVNNGAQVAAFDVTVSITETDSGYVVKEIANMAMGQAVDMTQLQRKSYRVMQRWISMGPQKFHFVFDASIKPRSATAKIIATDVPLFADGGGAYEVMALLPLAANYETSFYNFNVMSQKADKMLLRVVARESIPTTIGTYDCWKVELKHETSPGLFTIWVSADNKRIVVKRRAEFQTMVTESILSEVK